MGARLSTIQNYIGRKYGRLTVISDLGCISSGKRRMVTAVCDCGVTKDYLISRLKKGDTKSCGCILKENRYGTEFINQVVITDDSKICVMCKILKPKNEYHKGVKKSGVQSKCKECTTKYKKERYWANHEIELAKYTKSRTKPENLLQRKEYYEKNKSEYRERYLKWIANEENKKHRSRVAKMYNKVAYEKISKRASAYAKRPEVKARKKIKHLERNKTDIQYIIKRRLRDRLRKIVKALGSNKYKLVSSIELLGCDIEFFKTYFESTFTDDMCWGRISEIHVDHIKPCKKFDLTKLEEQKKCFHYSNLQALWAVDNLKKNAKYQEYV